MKQEKYDPVIVSADRLVYKFINYDRRLEEHKFIQFSKINETPIYSVGFGDLSASGKRLNGKVKSDHNHQDKALTIVAAIIYEFTARNPQAFIFFAGSDRIRTRLFGKIISAHID